eukprot:4168987-Alexandrium_andersonii.AAC.1
MPAYPCLRQTKGSLGGARAERGASSKSAASRNTGQSQACSGRLWVSCLSVHEIPGTFAACISCLAPQRIRSAPRSR